MMSDYNAMPYTKQCQITVQCLTPNNAVRIQCNVLYQAMSDCNRWLQAGPTTNGVACIDRWLGAGGWDVITLNFGIHDCCPGGDGRPAGKNVPKDEYVNANTPYTELIPVPCVNLDRQ